MMAKRSRKFAKKSKGTAKYDSYDTPQKALMFDRLPILIILCKEKGKEKGKIPKKEHDSDFKEKHIKMWKHVVRY